MNGMGDKIEEKTPEFPEQEKLKNEAVGKIDLYADQKESYEAGLPDPELAKNEEERASLKEAPSWQLQEEEALKLQEVHGAVEADTAVQEDTAVDPEEVRTKELASVTEGVYHHQT